MAKYSMADYIDIANGKAQLEPDIEWNNLFEETLLKQLQEYCWAHHTELEYVIVPYFIMSGAVTGKDTQVQSGSFKSGRTNLYLLMGGNPASGKSCGFELAVNKPKAEIENMLGFSTFSCDLSRTALLFQLQQQTDECRPFLIIASDEMGLSLNGEARDSKEWELKRVIYNNSFSGTDIVSERMRGINKVKQVKIQNPHMTIIGMTQPKPLFVWIRNVASNDDGLLERYLIWIVKESPNSKIIPQEAVTISNDWPTRCLLMLMKYHQTNHTKQYFISFELYKKVHELEMKTTRASLQQWDQFLELLADGKEEEAIQFRQNTNTSVIRYSELVLRFSVGLHVGHYALKRFLAGLPIDNIPEQIEESTINFAISSVKRCLNQVQHFRAAATRFSAKEATSKGDKNSQAVKKEELPKQKINDKLGKMVKEEHGIHSQSQQWSISKKYNSEKHEQFEQLQLNKLETERTEEELDSDLLKKVVMFPAPFFVPRAIYRYAREANAEDVLKIFSYVTQSPSNDGYLGELVKIKPNAQARRSYVVLFRAPYEKVDQKLLEHYNISREKYEEILTTELGGSDCKLRKVIETQQTKWEQFYTFCLEKKPSFS